MKLEGDKLLPDLQKAIEINELTANILSGSKKKYGAASDSQNQANALSRFAHLIEEGIYTIKD